MNPSWVLAPSSTEPIGCGVFSLRFSLRLSLTHHTLLLFPCSLAENGRVGNRWHSVLENQDQWHLQEAILAQILNGQFHLTFHSTNAVLVQT